ncbi:MAG: DUF1501 domain-containing protein [Bryobacterales bacterium]|nr:DUF1501 domain-containing protein [Bryobacterales bacterium]
MLLSQMRARYSRRDFLRVGGTSIAGVSLPQLLAASPGRSERSCLVFFQSGGVCQHDSFDPKPEAPAGIRGGFGTIPTAVPGVRFSELLPRSAANLGRFSVIRSMFSLEAIHEKAKQYAFSGQRPNNAYKHPVYGSVVARERGARNGLPPFVVIPNRDISADAGFLGSAYDPFVAGDPAKEKYSVQDLSLPTGLGLEEARGRAHLLARLDARLEALEKSDVVSSMDHFYQKALDLVSSPQAKRAFDLGSEPDKLRDAYGRTTGGQGALLARRLIEAGVRLVTVFHGGYDTHTDNDKRNGTLYPEFDQAFNTLLEDMDARGLLSTTIVLAISEFGRTPEINHSAGRDHWPGVFSIAVAGAGVPGGQVIGSSDRLGAEPADRPVSIEDLGATVYRKLGIDAHKEYHAAGRPIRINDGGEPIPELFA